VLRIVAAHRPQFVAQATNLAFYI
jgi:hypothetical protein